MGMLDTQMDTNRGATMYYVWLERRTHKPTLAMKYGDRPDDEQKYIQAQRGAVWADDAETALKKFNYWRGRC